jgi:hypothetical protein
MNNPASSVSSFLVGWAYTCAPDSKSALSSKETDVFNDILYGLESATNPRS